MIPMANRLLEVLDKASFDYSTKEMEQDIIDIENIADGKAPEKTISKFDVSKLGDSVNKGVKSVGAGITGLFSKKASDKKEDNLEQIKKLKELLDLGAISQEEFDKKKKELLNL